GVMPDDPQGSGADKPAIQTGTGPETIRALQKAVDGGQIPDTYVSSGRVVHVEKVSGTVGGTTGDEDSPLPVTASDVTPPMLANLLATHTYTFTVKTRRAKEGVGETYEEEVTPSPAALTAALAPK